MKVEAEDFAAVVDNDQPAFDGIKPGDAYRSGVRGANGRAFRCGEVRTLMVRDIPAGAVLPRRAEAAGADARRPGV